VRYENNLTYVACVAEVNVDRSTGRVMVQRLSVAHDCGLIVNPNGLQNQIEGNCLQATSRALKEQISFDQNGVTSLDWRGYPILTFPEVPDVQIQLLDHPDQPAWGAGEPTTEAIPAAIANAIFDATGARVRTIPMTAARVKAAMVPD
jgi:CO/xanthine dehydrogenase Mo-binding subunit